MSLSGAEPVSGAASLRPWRVRKTVGSWMARKRAGSWLSRGSRATLESGREIPCVVWAVVPGVGEVGEWQNKLVARNPGWNEVLDRASKAPGSKVKKIT